MAPTTSTLFIAWEISGWDCGELRTISGNDAVINSNTLLSPLDSDFLDTPDIRRQTGNFDNQMNLFSAVENFKVVAFSPLIKEYSTSVILKMPFFYNDGTITRIRKQWRKQFPLIDFDYITPTDFQRWENGPEHLLTFEIDIDFLAMYPDAITNPVETPIVSFQHLCDGEAKPFAKIEINHLNKLNGSTVILDGDTNFNGSYPELIRWFEKQNMPLDGICNLYKDKAAIANITKFDNIIIETTGINSDGIAQLMNAFKQLKFVPKRVFFTLETLYFNEPEFTDVEFYNVRLSSYKCSRV